MKISKFKFLLLFFAILFMSKVFAEEKKCACVPNLSNSCAKLNKYVEKTDDSDLKNSYIAGNCEIELDFHGGGYLPNKNNCPATSTKHITVARIISNPGSVMRVRYHIFNIQHKIKNTREWLYCTTKGY